jgi:protein gp37
VSAIEWTGITWNPVTGCDRISPGCDHCYALTLARRLKAMGQARYQLDGDPRTSGPGFAVTCHPAALALPYRWQKPRLVFVNSMSDLFHARVPEFFIRDVFEVMAATPVHTYQVLTKRPHRALRLARTLPWPGNVWLGVSIENPRYLWRAGLLSGVPAAVRFISAEPLLGPLPALDLTGISWLIAGGESGPGYRPPDPAWVRAIRDQCAAAAVPFFFKQWGGLTPKAGGRVLDGRTWDQMPAVTSASGLAGRGNVRPGLDPSTQQAEGIFG